MQHSLEEYYLNYEGGGRWKIYHHGVHPGATDEEGPFDARELAVALREFGFEPKEMDLDTSEEQALLSQALQEEAREDHTKSAPDF